MDEFVLLFSTLNTITLSEEKDRINWRWMANGSYSASSAYNIQFLGSTVPLPATLLWKATTEPKCRFFVWLAIHRRMNTADNLAKKNCPCNPICSLCYCLEETTDHLLSQCNFVEVAWGELAANLQLNNALQIPNMEGALQWFKSVSAIGSRAQKKENIGILFTFWWQIWKERDRRIFQHREQSFRQVAQITVSEFRLLSEMASITNVYDYEKLAKQKLSKMVYDFYAAGAEDQWTLNENKEAFSRILFRPRVLIDVSHIDMSTSVLGYKIPMPIMVAPTALHKLAHPEGELASARASAAAGTIMTLSSWSSCSIEEVNSTGPGIRFFQLSIYKDMNLVQQLVRRAEKAGYKAIIITVDAPRLGRREADVRNRFTLPPNVVLKSFEGLDLGNMDKTNSSGLAAYVASQVDSTISWKIIKWLQAITQLPILVKGILTPEDTRIAIGYGVAGIIVSNHGGRQLDSVPATISCLEEVAREAKDRVPVFLDSGIRRGTDVFKALALGASGVFIGRPLLFALAVDGEAGVRNALRMVRDELEIAMALNGCTSLKDITRNHVSTESDRLRISRL